MDQLSNFCTLHIMSSLIFGKLFFEVLLGEKLWVASRLAGVRWYYFGSVNAIFWTC